MHYYILIFIILEILFSGYFYNAYQEKLKAYKEHTTTVVNNTLKSTINIYEMIYDNAYATQSDTIAQLVASANNASIEKRNIIREELLKRYISFFNYQKLNALNGMHIFDKEGVSLLRFHEPLHNEDKIINKRVSLQNIIKTYRYEHGFEVGVFQESYRFQYPLFYDGEFVGSYEYSVDSRAIIDKMNDFYGDDYQLFFKDSSLKKVIKKEFLNKNYKEINLANQSYYIKKHFSLKKLNPTRLTSIQQNKEFQQALNSSEISILNYTWNMHSHTLIVLPLKDIAGKVFAYTLIHLNDSALEEYKNTFFINIFFFTVISLLILFYIYKEIQNKKYTKELINLQHDLIVVSDGKNLTDANTAFLKFFGYNTLKEFKKEHPCVCDMFLEEEGFLKKEHDNLIWINYIQNQPSIQHKVKMLDLNSQEKIFSVALEKLKTYDKYFIIFHDITEDQKVKEQLEKRAYYDSLTHIHNRERFEYFLSLELKKAQRYDTSFSLIMFDIDHFKTINDTYGHDVGDSVLQELTQLIALEIRDIDIFARWGGEEFMIITHTDIYQSEMFAEKLRLCVQNYTFKYIKKLTCSFGVTQYRVGDTPQTIVKRCDNMLYSAKKSGRNCVVSIK